MPGMPALFEGIFDHVGRVEVFEMNGNRQFLEHGRMVKKLPSWRGHSWPPRAHQAASEGVGLPPALVRRGPASYTPSERPWPPSQRPHDLTISLRLTIQARHVLGHPRPAPESDSV